VTESTDIKARAQRPSRRSGVTDAAFNPGSLVGSWLHVMEGDRIVADGLIVGEPGPGIFLVELISEGRTVQSLHSIRDIFYDSDSEMRDAYAAWLVEREKA
jgi:hypothetical protein